MTENQKKNKNCPDCEFVVQSFMVYALILLGLMVMVALVH